jgi:predicted RNase H-like HicB family nuclease
LSEYVVIYEPSTTGWGGYCPDLPGLGVAGETRAEVERLIREGIEIHIASLREHREPVPEPTTATDVVAVTTA